VLTGRFSSLINGWQNLKKKTMRFYCTHEPTVSPEEMRRASDARRHNITAPNHRD
jgi:hypothetical protein